jgi:putative oxidoreductase
MLLAIHSNRGGYMDLSKQLYKNISLLLLRLVVVFVFLWHGIPKAINPSMAMEKFVAMGFPAFFGPIIGWLEVIAAVLVLIGIWHMWANILLAGIIAVALAFVHIPKGVTAGLERDMFIFTATLVLALHGPGHWHLGKKEQ